MIGNLYMGQRVKIRIDGKYSEPGKIGRGVRQGCPLSPILFNIYIEEIIRFYKRGELLRGNAGGDGRRDKGGGKDGEGIEICR